ncbi:PREDICTED: protein disulfide-isomerase 5-3 [Tarenaya hassleriana]|uniref:protein disulfide-isomerase 5-3 n=1 Tax=Tarenaya hassleriana TaxID=28532 RepID=UPI00053C0966|nr:PREDICTED: protein disulfide-isomerase 5-3 [Tarenaya hassleriana]
MVSTNKIKSVDFYRKIPRDLTEASLSGAGLSIVAALAMIFLFGMELSSYLAISTTTSVIVDKSSDGDFLRIDFNVSFPALSCEFASVDVSDVLGTNRLNITKTIRKFPIDPHLRATGSEFHSGPVLHVINHGEETNEETVDGSVMLTGANFETFSHHYQILVVNFYAPWCYWSNRLKPSWEKATNIIRQRYNPETDGRVLLGKVDCTEESALCRRNHIQGYPSIRIFRKGSDVREDHGHHEHESYYGDRDTESLVKMVEGLVASIHVESRKLALEDKSDNNASTTLKKAPVTGGCRIEGYVRVKKVPGNLVISARSGSHSFDTSQMNMSHVVSHLSFGKVISPRLLTDMRRLLPYLGQSHDRLNGRAFINQRELGANVTIEHYLQVVKTEVITLRSGREQKMIEEYEYTAHSSVAQTFYLPVAKFHFELSPMQVLITENSKSFSHFITNVCAIIGGIFTVAGILDSIFHNTIRMMKKVELGKNI